MSLTCSCEEDGDWWYFPPEDYSALSTKRGRRCCSCKAWIKVGQLSTKFECFRATDGDVEERIYGECVPMAPKFMCEACSDQFFNLSELGFCINLGSESMEELRREYVEVYGAKA